jgi:hypothetical protein
MKNPIKTLAAVTALVLGMSTFCLLAQTAPVNAAAPNPPTVSNGVTSNPSPAHGVTNNQSPAPGVNANLPPGASTNLPHGVSNQPSPAAK